MSAENTIRPCLATQEQDDDLETYQTWSFWS